MKLFISFLRSRKTALLCLVLTCVIFITVVMLYGFPAEPVLYALALTLFTVCLIGIADFSHCKARHAKLTSLERCEDNISEKLPEPDSIEEEAYKSLVEIIERDKHKALTDRAASLNETADYYTMWVHQIKTPISAMRLLLQSAENPDPEMSEQLFRIEQYVEMVLTYIRCGFDTSDYVIRSQPLDAIIKSTVKKYAGSFIRKKLTLDYRETHLTAVTDEKWLSFVIGQVLSNSLKYTNSGTISIYTEDNSLIISDTGIGIAPEDLPRVFDKGYTGYNGRGDRKSTGIGLYLCKLILDKLSHSISISSAVGEGTSVKITFPDAPSLYE